MKRFILLCLMLPSCASTGVPGATGDAHTPLELAVSNQVRDLHWLGVAALSAAMIAFCVGLIGFNGLIRKLSITAAFAGGGAWLFSGLLAAYGVLTYRILGVIVIACVVIGLFFSSTRLKAWLLSKFNRDL